MASVAVATLMGSAGFFTMVAAESSSAAITTLIPKAVGGLDCNGQSPIQAPVKRSMLCTDIRGFAGVDNANVWNNRFYDNGVYIGHDEPDMTFQSTAPGSGDAVNWSEKLPTDPAAAPTVSTPGSDVNHWFELSVAPWFSMAMCDPNSYPQLPCTPQSDRNAPRCNGMACSPHEYPGAGSAFMEMQFYPPGFAPFSDSTSCDNKHWCAALTIDSAECTLNFANCNPNCVEPVNFAFIQTDGVPAGPPSPQLSDLNTLTPNNATLLMNPGDVVTVHMADAPAPGGGKAFEVVLNDMTTGQSGFMQASAANGFANTSIVDCSGTPFNFQPEYNTAKAGNITPWAALQTDISTQFETGHFEACTSLGQAVTFHVSGSSVTDKTWNKCNGPYENSAPGGDGGSQPEAGDAFCYPKGDTHGAQNTAPDQVTGCTDGVLQNGDLDFDGNPYWADWPTGPSPTATFPGSFVQSLPTQGNGAQYGQFFIQTDLALSESTCTASSLSGCTVPPPNAPGKFYPYWSRVDVHGNCTLEFGNVSTGRGVNTFGGDAQYGTNQIATQGYPEFEGPITSNACT
jgi:hypothetical protein